MLSNWFSVHVPLPIVTPMSVEAVTSVTQYVLTLDIFACPTRLQEMPTITYIYLGKEGGPSAISIYYIVEVKKDHLTNKAFYI